MTPNFAVIICLVTLSVSSRAVDGDQRTPVRSTRFRLRYSRWIANPFYSITAAGIRHRPAQDTSFHACPLGSILIMLAPGSAKIKTREPITVHPIGAILWIRDAA